MRIKEMKVDLDTGIVHESLTQEEKTKEEIKELLERKKARELMRDEEFNAFLGVKETGFRIGSDQHIKQIIADSITTIKNDAGTKAVYIIGSLENKYVASFVQTTDDNPILLDQSKKYAREHSCKKWAHERLKQHEFKTPNSIIIRMKRITHELNDLHSELDLSLSLEKVNKNLFTPKRDEMYRYQKITMEWKKSENNERPDLEIHVDGELKGILKHKDLPYAVTKNAHWEMKQAWGK